MAPVDYSVSFDPEIRIYRIIAFIVIAAGRR
jgi:hypothetical protein